MATRRPTKEELLAAGARTLPDVIAPGLKVLFCGINPGLYTAWVGHHFARPGNRFWKALHAGGFTPRVLDPSEEQLLLEFGSGCSRIPQGWEGDTYRDVDAPHLTQARWEWRIKRPISNG